MGLADFCELLLCSVCSLKVGPVFTSLSDTPHVSMWLLGCLVSQRLILCVGYHVGHRLAGCQQFLKSTARTPCVLPWKARLWLASGQPTSSFHSGLLEFCACDPSGSPNVMPPLSGPLIVFFLLFSPSSSPYSFFCNTSASLKNWWACKISLCKASPCACVQCFSEKACLSGRQLPASCHSRGCILVPLASGRAVAHGGM